MPNDQITGNVGDEGQTIAVGKGIQQVNVHNAGPDIWREMVQRDLHSLGNRIDDLRASVQLAMIAIVVIFVCGLVGIAFMVRGLDLINLEIENRIEEVQRMIPTPTPWPWGDIDPFQDRLP